MSESDFDINDQSKKITELDISHSFYCDDVGTSELCKTGIGKSSTFKTTELYLKSFTPPLPFPLPSTLDKTYIRLVLYAVNGLMYTHCGTIEYFYYYSPIVETPSPPYVTYKEKFNIKTLPYLKEETDIPSVGSIDLSDFWTNRETLYLKVCISYYCTENLTFVDINETTDSSKNIVIEDLTSLVYYETEGDESTKQIIPPGTYKNIYVLTSYGLSMVNFSSKLYNYNKATADTTCSDYFVVQVYPRIDTLNYNRFSELGGQKLTITGIGFTDFSNLKLLVGNFSFLTDTKNICRVIESESDFNKITCVTGRAAFLTDSQIKTPIGLTQKNNNTGETVTKLNFGIVPQIFSGSLPIEFYTTGRICFDDFFYDNSSPVEFCVGHSSSMQNEANWGYYDDETMENIQSISVSQYFRNDYSFYPNDRSIVSLSNKCYSLNPATSTTESVTNKLLENSGFHIQGFDIGTSNASCSLEVDSNNFNLCNSYFFVKSIEFLFSNTPYLIAVNGETIEVAIDFTTIDYYTKSVKAYHEFNRYEALRGKFFLEIYDKTIYFYIYSYDPINFEVVSQDLLIKNHYDQMYFFKNMPANLMRSQFKNKQIPVDTTHSKQTHLLYTILDSNVSIIQEGYCADAINSCSLDIVSKESLPQLSKMYFDNHSKKLILVFNRNHSYIEGLGMNSDNWEVRFGNKIKKGGFTKISTDDSTPIAYFSVIFDELSDNKNYHFYVVIISEYGILDIIDDAFDCNSGVLVNNKDLTYTTNYDTSNVHSINPSSYQSNYCKCNLYNRVLDICVNATVCDKYYEFNQSYSYCDFCYDENKVVNDNVCVDSCPKYKVKKLSPNTNLVRIQYLEAFTQNYYCDACDAGKFALDGDCVEDCGGFAVESSFLTSQGTTIEYKYCYRCSNIVNADRTACVDECDIGQIVTKDTTGYSRCEYCDELSPFSYKNSCYTTCPLGSSITNPQFPYICQDTICENGLYSYNSDCISKCPSYYFYIIKNENNADFSVCVKCNDLSDTSGHANGSEFAYIENNVCVNKCSSNAYLTKNDYDGIKSQCTFCENGLKINYEETECIDDCDLIYYYDIPTNRCKSCENDLVIIDNQCATNCYVIDDENGITDNTYYIEGNTCTICKLYSEYLNNENKRNCIETCDNFIDELSKKCIKCEGELNYFSEFDKKCYSECQENTLLFLFSSSITQSEDAQPM